MSMIWAGAVEIALAWAVILGVKIASNAFEWKFEHLLPNYWYPVVKRKLAKPETATLKDKGIPKKISDELEGLPDIQSSWIRKLPLSSQGLSHHA